MTGSTALCASAYALNTMANPATCLLIIASSCFDWRNAITFTQHSTAGLAVPVVNGPLCVLLRLCCDSSGLHHSLSIPVIHAADELAPNHRPCRIQRLETRTLSPIPTSPL